MIVYLDKTTPMKVVKKDILTVMLNWWSKDYIGEVDRLLYYDVYIGNERNLKIWTKNKRSKRFFTVGLSDIGRKCPELLPKIEKYIAQGLIKKEEN